MGASVGIGGLIIGVSMLVVFSMAYQSIALQIDSGIDRIDDAEEPIPSFSIDDLDVDDGAVVTVTINSGGSGYNAGSLKSSTGNGGFEGTFGVDGTGAINTVVITSHGDYVTFPGFDIDCAPACPGASGATLSATLGDAVYANFTNTGSTTVPHDRMWLFFDGQDAAQFSTLYTPPTPTTNWYSGETLTLVHTGSGIMEERLSLTVGSITVSLEA